MMMHIRPYEKKDETGWLRCRVLAFLDTAYYDHVLKNKERYSNPSIELVALDGEEIVGLIDIEFETTPGSVCSNRSQVGGMIWHIAVHPDYRRRGIGHSLLVEAIDRAQKLGTQHLEAWTRDDPWVKDWYLRMGFTWVESYLQVYMDGGKELKGSIESRIPQLYPVHVFAHYTGEDKANIRERFSRVHETNLYRLQLLQ
ncbi:GNAT family N-acetyltransferase [Paenibacillus sp. PR3]|uniref:GNAT family N-acetyltransferase n=1 Tax=Paenibacillus terricola TaxID=2763503 RepID=A0ABR8MZ99_9BACL|nr:GNAT family N-acetyltransferase [Paenibacillus terricola]MBD3919859.1 GNAT family N-acetyltransferase [Paenibacillus terricola]